MEYNKIKSIQKIGKKAVYDIHHNIPTGAFIDDQPNILTEAGLISNCGRHAGGVVLTDSPIEKQNMPLVIGGKGDKRSLQTPWTEGVNFRMLEHFGFLKFDFLALGTLRIFENTVRKILKKQTGRLESEIPFEEVQKWFYEHLSPDKNPMDDINVYKHVFWNGNFISIFQFVKPNTQDFMKRMKPVSVKDISIATSIHRPGPLGLKVDRDFLNNRANPEKIKYEHPFLKEVLEPTSGLLIFQEQLQLIYHHLCGVPLDETDSVRKAFTKKEINNKEKAAKEREKLKTEFVEKTKQFAGMDSTKSSIFFDKMEKLVAYSFNASLKSDTKIPTYNEKGTFEVVKTIDQIKPGDFVKSRNEKTKKTIFIKVKKLHDHGKIPVFKFKLDDGTEVVCSMDHKFRVKDGRMLPIKQILVDNLEIEKL
jgi:hypothetical protein